MHKKNIDFDEAFRRLESARRQKPSHPMLIAWEAIALHPKARFWGDESVHKDKFKSSQLWNKAARAGLLKMANSVVDKALTPIVQYLIGMYEFYGRKDKKKAFEWYQKSAESGYPVAQHCLGYMYRFGVGLKHHDLNLAFQWYTKAAEQGHAYAQYDLAYMYEHGHGVNQNRSIAAEWYKLAGQQGLIIDKQSRWEYVPLHQLSMWE